MCATSSELSGLAEAEAGINNTSIHISHTVLLISDTPVDAELIRKALAESAENDWDLKQEHSLATGISVLAQKSFAAIILDLYLPDSAGLPTFAAVFKATPFIPIVVLTSRANNAIAMQAVTLGAQDHLLKNHLDPYWLPRVLQSVIARNANDETRFREKERAQITLNSIGDAVLSADLAGKVTYLNPVAEEMTGWTCEEAVGRPFTDVLHIIDEVTRKVVCSPMKRALEENQTVELLENSILVRRDGLEYAIEDSAAPIHDRTGQAIGAVIVFHDVSASRAILQKMSHMAQHDFLTDLPNRMLLTDRIALSIALAARHNKKSALLFMDLDGFKIINDSLGHAVGDKLLQSVGQRLKTCVRCSDTVSRQGGDEFVVLLAEIDLAEDAGRTAEKILAALAAPHEIGTHSLLITASIGISVYPDDSLSAESMLKCADIAMYHAKQKGRNNHQFFLEEKNVQTVERQFMEDSLKRALGRGEFVLHYQPKINLKTGEIAGAEALIRWCHPDRGLIPPAMFMPIVEDCGLIVAMGRWVLRESCRQAQAWIDLGFPPIPVAVNISRIEFYDTDFVDNLRIILAETRLKPAWLELEFTESTLMKDAKATPAVLLALKSLGVRLVIDDFGTGYASLSYLRHFPLDTIKIDQAFVGEINTDSMEESLIGVVISMAKSFKQKVLAKGIETKEQLAYLQTQSCDEGQGFYFSHPVVAADLITLRMLKRNFIYHQLPTASMQAYQSAIRKISTASWEG